MQTRITILVKLFPSGIETSKFNPST